MAKILLKNITKVFPNKFKALENFNLEVKDKEFLVLVGSSGCGKSTVLRIIAGLEDITDGQLFIGDRDVGELSPKERNISMVFQDYALYPHMTIYQNMAFALKISGMKKKEIHEKILAVAKKFEIEDCLYKKPATMSGGQKQRAALGRAILRNPDVFLFDEPLSNIDAKLRSQMRIELIKLHKQLQTTFIYVTHDQTEAMTMGERIVVMKDGEIQQIDTPHNVYYNPVNLFTAGFIGTPQMNFIQAKLENEDDKRLYLTFDVDSGKKYELKNVIEITDSKNVIVGIRPENIYVKSNNEKLDDEIVLNDCKTEAVELLGHDKLVYYDVNGVRLVSKQTAEEDIDKGDKVSLGCLIKNIHIFDSKTERKIQLW